MTSRKTIAVDLDGVLADFRDGWKGLDHIGDPIPGAREFLRRLHELGDVLIWTTRCNPELARGTAAPLLRTIVREWLVRHGLMQYVADIWIGPVKPIAAAFVDDRAVRCAPQDPLWTDGGASAYALAIGRENERWPDHLCQMPREMWPDAYRLASLGKAGLVLPLEVWRSRRSVVQVYSEANGVLRMSVNRPALREDGRWRDGLTWDELQRLKREIGRGDLYAVEVYPRDADVVNVANMRHLWLLPEPLPIGWTRSSEAVSP